MAPKTLSRCCPTKKWNEIIKDSLLKCNSPMSRSDESISLISCTIEFMDGKCYMILNLSRNLVVSSYGI